MIRIFRRSSLVALVMAMHCFHALSADTLILVNGDRISGKLEERSAESIVFVSDLLGRLVLPVTSVKHVEKSRPTEPLHEAETTVLAGDLSAPSSEAVSETPQSRVLQLLDYFNPFKDWQSRLSLGYSWLGGETSRHNLFVLFEAQRERERSEWKVRGRWDYGSTRIDRDTSRKTEDRYQAGLQYRRNLNPSIFFQSRTDYRKDLVRRIDHDFEQSLGMGWRVFSHPRFRATLTPSYTVRYREVPDSPDGWQSLLSLFQDLRYQIHPRVILHQDAAISFEPAETSRSEYRFAVRLENRVTDRLSIDLRYEYQFQYLVGIGVEGRERKFIAAMGYRF